MITPSQAELMKLMARRKFVALSEIHQESRFSVRKIRYDLKYLQQADLVRRVLRLKKDQKLKYFKLTEGGIKELEIYSINGS